MSMLITKNSSFSKTRWVLIAIFFSVILSAGFLNKGSFKNYLPLASITPLFIAMFLHSKARYGLVNTLVFFVITWVVSNFFESLSIMTGFPFGHYFYDKLIGPRIVDVPILIMPTYFSMGYAAWTLSHILLNQYHQQLQGKQIFFIPLVATFIMVMWDLCMDPILSTIDHLWVWKEQGVYFGVPLSNFAGWFLVVFIIFQLFAVYITKKKTTTLAPLPSLINQFFWLEAVAVYGIQGLLQLLNPLTQADHFNIYGPMALVSFFSMIFVTIISFIIVKSHKVS